MALAGHFVAATDYEVSAKVPAIPPMTPPVILQPNQGSTVSSGDVIVGGTCPIAEPAVIVALYDGDVFKGSVQCDSDGKFALPVSFVEGVHNIVAKVVSITGDQGGTSVVTQFTFKKSTAVADAAKVPPSVGGTASVNGAPIVMPVIIVPKNVFSTLNGENATTWLGAFLGGALPYKITVDWGDGRVETFNVSDHEEQAYSHRYSQAGDYVITITVVDANGTVSSLKSVAVTFKTGYGSLFETRALLFDPRAEYPASLFVFLQNYILQIYILCVSSLIFLWYMEHGRKVSFSSIRTTRVYGARKRVHSSKRRNKE